MLRLSLVIVVIVGTPGGPVRAVSVAGQEVVDRQKEYNLKAVFLYSFGRYITWSLTSASKGDFKIGVLGESPITEKIRQVAQKRDLNGRRLTVETPAKTDDLSKYHLLFISQAIPSEEATRLIDSLSPNTIVVGERDELFDVGASIIFFIDGTSVRFELNRHNLQTKNVQLDAKLLRLSRPRR